MSRPPCYYCGFLIDPDAGVVYGPSGRPIAAHGPSGYVKVRRDGRHFAMAHRLVWEAVHGPIPEGLQVNHINGIKHDNRISNLEIVTPSENTKHAYATGLLPRQFGRGRARLCADEVRAIRASTEPSRVLAEKYSVASSTIRAARTGHNWGHVE